MNDSNSHLPQAARLVERWLVGQLISSPSQQVDLTALGFQAPPERLALVRGVLDAHPTLAQAARALSAYDQLRLTLELVRTHESVAVGQPVLVGGVRSPARCRSRPRYRR